ncbi:MAG: hypothetical protein MUP52_11170, partial [Candidatus Aminicenantes bacterium]|nr:hypothetical protein [Candidatus Aminicenantes bacterium]
RYGDLRAAQAPLIHCHFISRVCINFGRGPVAALPRPCSPPGRCARAGNPFAAPPLLDFPAPRKKNYFEGQGILIGFGVYSL